MQMLLETLSIDQREKLARATGTMVQYYGNEVQMVRDAEEKAALRALPPGYATEDLNGINVGCGDRAVDPMIVGTDAHKGDWEMGSGSCQKYSSSAMLLAWSNDLPLKANTMDFVIAIHILEHEPDPVATVLHWLDIVKPGGGVGIILPDWRYTWDARVDHHSWGHRWNPTPELARRLYDQHWQQLGGLEHFGTYPFKISFDLVIRKHGQFSAFNPEYRQAPTGHELLEQDRFLHAD
jgi:SAM-dependent methyltransferase